MREGVSEVSYVTGLSAIVLKQAHAGGGRGGGVGGDENGRRNWHHLGDEIEILICGSSPPLSLLSSSSSGDDSQRQNRSSVSITRFVRHSCFHGRNRVGSTT